MSEWQQHTCANEGHSPSKHAVINTVRDADDCAMMPKRGRMRRKRKSEKRRNGRSSGRREQRHESGMQQKYADGSSESDDDGDDLRSPRHASGCNAISDKTMKMSEEIRLLRYCFLHCSWKKWKEYC